MVIVDAFDLAKSFGVRQVFSGVNLRVSKGERLVVLGGNGSGKSTLLFVLAGVLTADSGVVDVRGTLGLAPEKPDLPDHLVVAEWLDVVASLKGMRRRSEVAFRADTLAGVKLAALSLGQRQRVSLAAAWLGAPSVMVLDEPTNAIDIETREELVARLRGETAIIATHDESFAATVATRRVVMKGGRLFDA